MRPDPAPGDQAAPARGTTLAGLRRSLRGDVEHIVRRALVKQPDARYVSVAALADDLRAFVHGRAISGGSRRYRMRMFARRHWLPLAAAAAVLLIVAGSALAIVRQSRQVAREAQTTLAVKDFLFGLFTAVDPRTAKGREINARELLDGGAERIGRNKALDGLQRAEVEATLGRIYYQLGAFEQADRLQQHALAALALVPDAAALHLRTELDRVETLVDVSDVKGAQTLLEDVQGRLAASADDSTDAARAALAESRLAVDKRDWAKTGQLADAALARLRSMPDPDAALVRRALLSSGAASWGLGRTSQAEATFREALAVAEADGEGDSIDAAKASMNIALALNAQSRYAQAVAADEKALAIFTKILGAEHQLTLGARRDLALVHFRLGLYPQAREEFEQVIAAERKQFGDAHPLVAAAEMNLGNVLIESGEAAAAEKVLSDARSIFEKKYGSSHEGARQAVGNLAVAIAAQGRLDEAERQLRDLLEREHRESPELVDNIDNYRLGDVLRQRGRFDEALALQRGALASLLQLHGENHRWTAAAHRYLALSLRDSGDFGGAEREWRAALAGFPDAEPPFVATVRYELGSLLLKQDPSRTEAIELLASAAELREKFLGADSPLSQQARAAVGRAPGL
jgi:serine/threonine-protein kinase